MEKVVIFDFDGTLADIEDMIKKLYAQVAAEKGWPPLTDEAYRRLRTGNVAEAIRWVGVRPWQVPGLMREGRKRVYALRNEIELFPGILNLLKQLHKDGWQIYVLSANSPKTIKEVLNRYDLGRLVTVLRRPALFGKAMSIKNLMRSQKYDRQTVWMVGDEVRDIEAAQKAGVHSIAVSWGLQDIDILKTYQPTAIANKAQDIANTLNKGIIAR